MRSRTGTLPRSRCRAMALSSPPAPRSETPAVRSRSSATRAVIRATFACSSAPFGSSRERRTDMAPSVLPGLAHEARPEPPATDRRLAAMQPVSWWCARLGSLRLVFAALVLTGCTASASLPLSGPLVTVEMRGGMCADGGTCDSTVILDRDGRVHAAAKPPNDLGHVDGQAMATLAAAIEATDWTALKSHPFTGTCRMAFDGQELVFEFSVGPQVQRVASCEVDIDWGSPLFVAVGVALGRWVAVAITEFSPRSSRGGIRRRTTNADATRPIARIASPTRIQPSMPGASQL